MGSAGVYPPNLVTESVDGQDELRVLGIRLDLLAEPGGMDANGPGRWHRVVAPHLVERLVPRQYGFTVLDEGLELGDEPGRDLVALDDALQALAKFDERKSRVIELRFFGGLSVEETASVLNVSPDTVMRDWRLAKAFVEHARRTGRGCALGDNIGFVVDLPNRRSFSPDAAFHVGPLSDDFIDGPPVFAVEIRSKGDYGPAAEARLAAKRADYFAAGTLVVWDVDIERAACVRVYCAADPATPSEHVRGEVADAEPAVPGWSMPVEDLFPREP